ncbi:MAG: zinc/manganese transport system substrate-binding protein, partial [Gaiellales bacterium]|nr:zinc/manganese transport system substrate-binding protein [Gaiellales bacterium]
MRTVLIWVALLATLALTTTTVGVASVGATSPGRSDLQVVAAENFWGSIAAQLGGNRVHVTSVIANPATDPHGYEP